MPHAAPHAASRTPQRTPQRAPQHTPQRTHPPHPPPPYPCPLSYQIGKIKQYHAVVRMIHNPKTLDEDDIIQAGMHVGMHVHVGM